MPTQKTYHELRDAGQTDLNGCLPTFLHAADRVIDRDAAVERPEDDELDLAVVVKVTNTRADDRAIPAADGMTVADLNPDYAPEERVVRVIFAPALDIAFGDRWLNWDGEELYEQVVTAYEGNRPLRTYDYPAARLKRVASHYVTDRTSLADLAARKRAALFAGKDEMEVR